MITESEKHLNSRLVILFLMVIGLFAFSSTADAQFTSYRLSTPAGVSPSPIDFRVGYYSALQIYRDGDEQLYHPNRSPNSLSMYNGLFMLVDDYLITGANNGIYDYANSNWLFDDYWRGDISGVSGSGTIADPWLISAEYRDFSTNYGIDVTYEYVNGEESIHVGITPILPAGNTDVIKVFHIMDTYLEGTDTGAAYASGSPPYDVLGVDGDPNIEAFIAGDTPWDRYASGEFSTTLNEPWFDGELSNTLDTDPTTDNAMGVQWTLGVVAGVQPTINYQIAFTDNPITLECVKIISNRQLRFPVSNN